MKFSRYQVQAYIWPRLYKLDDGFYHFEIHKITWNGEWKYKLDFDSNLRVLETYPLQRLNYNPNTKSFIYVF